MPLKTSYFSFPLYIEGIRRHFWLSVIYMLCLLVFVPITILLNYYGPDPAEKFGSEFLRYSNSAVIAQSMQSPVVGFAQILMLIVPVLASILAFRHFQEKSQSDLLHSLPLNRYSLFSSSYMVGFSLFAGPILLNTLVLIVMKFVLQINSFDFVDISVWLGFTLMMSTVVYSISAFSGSILGVSTLQAIFTYLLMLMPAGLVLLLDYCFGNLLYGYSSNLQIRYKYLTPVFRIMDGISSARYENAITTNEVIGYMAVIVIFTVSAVSFFIRRPVENAGKPVAFTALSGSLKGLSAFCSALCGGYGANQVFNGTASLYIGYFLGGLLGYVLAEMIIRKSFRGQMAKKDFAVSMGLLIISAAALQFDIVGFQNWTPSSDDLSKITLETQIYYREDSRLTFKEPDNQRRLAALHQEILRIRNIQEKTGLRNVTFAFFDTEGHVHRRSYQIPEELFDRSLAPVYDSLEGKRNQEPILDVNSKDVNTLRIYPQFGKREVLITDPKLIDQALIALQEDQMNRKWEYEKELQRPWANISFEMIDHSITTDDDSQSYDGQTHTTYPTRWVSDDIKFKIFLHASGLISEVRYSAESIDKVLIKKYDTPASISERKRSEDTLHEEDPDVIVIKDPQKIQACLDTPNYYESNSPIFYAYTYIDSKDNPMESGIFSKDWPSFINDLSLAQIKKNQ